MSEIPFVISDTGGLRERLEQEINAFNATITGHHDSRILCITAHGNGGDCSATFSMSG